ncbi:unnamed protein product [Amoebophrya sp. A120]|nr:unnamed protein product [Amoebophrya sp. A120]|eukprot:GSA120T00023477001.1
MTIAMSCMPDTSAAPAEAISLQFQFSQGETPDLAASTCGQDLGPPTAKKDGPKTSDKPVPTEVHNYMKRAGKRKQVVMRRYKKLELRYTCQLRNNKKTKLGAAAAAAGAQTLGFVSVMVDGVQAVRPSAPQNLLKQKAARLEEQQHRVGGGAAAAADAMSANVSSDEAAMADGHVDGNFSVDDAGEGRSDATASPAEDADPG